MLPVKNTLQTIDTETDSAGWLIAYDGFIELVPGCSLPNKRSAHVVICAQSCMVTIIPTTANWLVQGLDAGGGTRAVAQNIKYPTWHLSSSLINLSPLGRYWHWGKTETLVFTKVSCIKYPDKHFSLSLIEDRQSQKTPVLGRRNSGKLKSK